LADKAGIRPAKIQGHNVTKLLRYKNLIKKQVSLLFLPIAMKKHAALVSGMLQALKRGQKCEIDYIDGVVSEYGRKYEVKTPVCDKICAMVHEIEGKKREITVENLAELNAAIKIQRGE
jgi:2-dehydropantoate 2-reductase